MTTMQSSEEAPIDVASVLLPYLALMFAREGTI